jgi:hypothetical protein
MIFLGSFNGVILKLFWNFFSIKRIYPKNKMRYLANCIKKRQSKWIGENIIFIQGIMGKCGGNGTKNNKLNRTSKCQSREWLQAFFEIINISVLWILIFKFRSTLSVHLTFQFYKHNIKILFPHLCIFDDFKVIPGPIKQYFLSTSWAP